MKRKLILFARYPLASKVKTRLIPALGAEGAAALHRRLVLRTLRSADALCRSRDIELEIRVEGGSEEQWRHWLGDGWRFRPQCSGDLGQRMSNAFEDSFREGSAATVIIGSDCPELTPKILAAAFDGLSSNDAVFGPATDGGYYLVGLTRQVPELFRGIVWGTEKVLAESLQLFHEGKGYQPSLLSPLDDVDRPEDLPGWRRLAEQEESDVRRVSVIIPALNEEQQITATLQAVRQCAPEDIIVVDGGSTDATARLVTEAGATVLRSKPGRARQMNAGAARAGGLALLFLHADTLLPPNWLAVVSRDLGQDGVAAGSFGFRIAGDFPAKSIVEWAVGFRSRRLQRPYGDQGLFLRRSLFEELGGFADLPIMEDYEFVSRLRRRGRVVTVAEPALTSARRWQRLGLLRTTLINQLIVVGFRLGFSPQKLERLYRGLACG